MFFEIKQKLLFILYIFLTSIFVTFIQKLPVFSGCSIFTSSIIKKFIIYLGFEHHRPGSKVSQAVSTMDIQEILDFLGVDESVSESLLDDPYVENYFAYESGQEKIDDHLSLDNLLLTINKLRQKIDNLYLNASNVKLSALTDKTQF